MEYYVLTDENDRTHDGRQWGEGVEHTATGKKGKDDFEDWIRCYKEPLIAAFLNPIMSVGYDPKTAHLWECEISGKLEQYHQTYFWYDVEKVKTLKRVDFPEVTTGQKIAFAILCSREIYKKGNFEEWASNWLMADRAAAEIETANLHEELCRSAKAATAAQIEHSAVSAAFSAALAATEGDEYSAHHARVAMTNAAGVAWDMHTKLDVMALAKKAIKGCPS